MDLIKLKSETHAFSFRSSRSGPSNVMILSTTFCCLKILHMSFMRLQEMVLVYSSRSYTNHERLLSMCNCRGSPNSRPHRISIIFFVACWRIDWPCSPICWLWLEEVTPWRVQRNRTKRVGCLQCSLCLKHAAWLYPPPGSDPVVSSWL